MSSVERGRRVYIVLTETHMAEAEIRTISLFERLVDLELDVSLVLGRSLCAELLALHPNGPLKTLADSVSTFDDGGDAAAGLRAHLARLRENDPHAILHFMGVSPLRAQSFVASHALCTVRENDLDEVRGLRRLELYGCVARAAHIDASAPRMRDALRRRFFWKASSITATRETRIDIDAFAPAALKRDDIVFASLFTETSQADRLLDQLESIHAQLRARGRDPRYFMIGRDVIFPGVVDRISEMGTRVPVRWVSEGGREIMARARVFLSLAKVDDRSSARRLEAMACGCLPVIAVRGDIRRSFPPTVAEYVPVAFEPADIASACDRILSLDEGERSARIAAARRYVSQVSCEGASADYYAQIYASMAS